MNTTVDINPVNIQQETPLERVKYPDLPAFLPPAQYIQLADVQTVSPQTSQLSTREHFLIKYHIYALIQYSIMLVLTLLGIFESFCSILIQNNIHYLAGHYYTFDEYKRYYGYDASYSDYITFKDNNYWIDRTYKWEFYLVLVLFILVSVAVLLGRKQQFIIRYQMILFFTQSILGGFLFVGFLGYDRDPYWRFYNTLKLFLIPLTCLVINSSFTIFLLKKQLIQHYGKLKYIAMVSCLIVLIAFMIFDRLWKYKHIPAIEFPIIYGLYFFEQLNKKLLLDPQKIKEAPDFMEFMQSINRTKVVTDQDIAQQDEEKQIVVSKKWVWNFGVFLLLVMFLVLHFSLQERLFLFFAFLCFINLLGLISDNQVASKTLGEDHHFIAVSITPFDALNPLRVIQNWLNC